MSISNTPADVNTDESQEWKFFSLHSLITLTRTQTLVKWSFHLVYNGQQLPCFKEDLCKFCFCSCIKVGHRLPSSKSAFSISHLPQHIWKHLYGCLPIYNLKFTFWTIFCCFLSLGRILIFVVIFLMCSENVITSGYKFCTVTFKAVHNRCQNM